MPGGDQTGPTGQGPMTGRGAGYCAGLSTPGYANQRPGLGRGIGFGRGRGFGFRRMAPSASFTPVYGAPVQPVYPQQQYPPTKEQETQMLEQEAKLVEQEQKELNNELSEIKKRIEELKKQK